MNLIMIIIIILILIYVWNGRESLVNDVDHSVYSDSLSYYAEDPIKNKYEKRLRDIDGMDSRDYYYTNSLLFNSNPALAVGSDFAFGNDVSKKAEESSPFLP